MKATGATREGLRSGSRKRKDNDTETAVESKATTRGKKNKTEPKGIHPIRQAIPALYIASYTSEDLRNGGTRSFNIGVFTSELTACRVLVQYLLKWDVLDWLEDDDESKFPSLEERIMDHVDQSMKSGTSRPTSSLICDFFVEDDEDIQSFDIKKIEVDNSLDKLESSCVLL